MSRILIVVSFFFLCVGAAGIVNGQTGVGGSQTSGLIFPPQGKHTHGSSLVKLSNGDMLAAWFQGSGERGADDVKIMGARMSAKTKAWSEPFLMADTRDIPDCNPVLFLNSQGKLFLFWIAVQANEWEYSIIRMRTSVNYLSPGAPVWNWQDNILLKPDDGFAREVEARFKDLPANHSGWSGYAPRYDKMIIEAAKDHEKRSIGWMTRIKPLQLPSGRILLPLYSDGFNLSIVAISDDNGESWRPSLPIVGRGPIQPALALKKNGHIVAYMRDSGDDPTSVQTSESADSGYSWTAAQKTEIPNTASVELLVLQDGRWAFLGNTIGDGRYRLTLMLSDDEGKTWKWREDVENDENKAGRYSYPCLIQAKDGLLHMTYSYQRAGEGESIKYNVVDPVRIHHE
ncbi:MAG: neuraminidase [Sphingobacteriales bacterium 50-39]|nr:exo-alpha-sialidase [Sphingobacteriales bacterium]OJW60948.1 MAG: neuraminidase [Sphingobacteriales bacterium 50-39]